MTKLRDKLWNWGHLEGSHNSVTLIDSKMSPEDFAKEYGVERSFIVSYGGNIEPPFDKFADRFSCLKEVKWSVIGDDTSPLPSAELGNTNDIISIAKTHSNVTGGVVDDFFRPNRMEKFTPSVLNKIRKTLNQNGLDFWSVLYNYQLDFENLSEYLNCFDGITFWIWGANNIDNVDKYLEKFFNLSKGKRKMLGVYLWDYVGIGKQPMNKEKFEKQLSKYFELLKNKTIDGIIFCSNTVGDANLETNKILKRYLSQYGDIEI